MARGRQLQALLRRGALGKADGWKGSLIELALPVAFASLLVLVKSIADVYDSPAVAYSCGPARPFDESTPALGELGWLGCYVRPELPACPIDTYLLRQTFLLALSPFRSRDIFDGAGTTAIRSTRRWATLRRAWATSTSSPSAWSTRPPTRRRTRWACRWTRHR